MKLHKRNKYERIAYVKSLGFNTEENILVKPTNKPNRYNKFLKNLDKCSIRTFTSDDKFSTPHYPILTKNQALKKIPQLQKKGYFVILATPIDPKDCSWCGAAMKTLDNIVIEIADGPGTVRRVTHEGKIDRRYILDRFNRLTPNANVNYVIDKFKKCELEEAIFEFSWYKIPVGHLKDQVIVWEVTDTGSRRSGI